MKNFDIFITHVASNQSVYFKPFLTSFSDNYKSDWQTNQVMGRMDNIATFKRTTRVIQMAFDVPAADTEEGKENLRYAKLLAKFLYPVYKETTITNTSGRNANSVNPPGATGKVAQLYSKLAEANTLESQLDLRKNLRIMASSPILSMKFANLVSDTNNEVLYGYLDGFNFKPDIEAGFFVNNCEDLIPKSFSVDLTFNVIHTEPLGWGSNELDQLNKYTEEEISEFEFTLEDLE